MKSCDETHTSIADEYEERAEAVDVMTNHPYSSCYDRDVGANGAAGACKNTPTRSKKNSKNLQDIAKERNSTLSDDGMSRKGVLTVSREKALFSTDQLVLVCVHMFDKLAFVLFKGLADASPYVIIIFSSNCQYGDVCELKTRVEIFKKEAAVDDFLMRFKVECIFTPEKYFQHLQDRSSGFIIRNENCGVEKELAALVKP